MESVYLLFLHEKFGGERGEVQMGNAPLEIRMADQFNSQPYRVILDNKAIIIPPVKEFMHGVKHGAPLGSIRFEKGNVLYTPVHPSTTQGFEPLKATLRKKWLRKGVEIKEQRLTLNQDYPLNENERIYLPGLWMVVNAQSSRRENDTSEDIIRGFRFQAP